MKSGEAVEARFFSIWHVPVAKRKMSKRQAGHAPNLHSPFPLAARAAFRPGIMAQRSPETLTRCSRHNARDSRISVHVRHGSRIAESRKRQVDILTKDKNKTEEHKNRYFLAGANFLCPYVLLSKMADFKAKPVSPSPFISHPIPPLRFSTVRFASRHESTGYGRKNGWLLLQPLQNLPSCS